MAKDRNQGEGNRDAARQYNRQTREFVQTHDTEKLAREAEPDNEREAREIERARQKAARGDTES